VVILKDLSHGSFIFILHERLLVVHLLLSLFHIKRKRQPDNFVNITLVINMHLTLGIILSWVVAVAAYQSVDLKLSTVRQAFVLNVQDVVGKGNTITNEDIQRYFEDQDIGWVKENTTVEACVTDGFLDTDCLLDSVSIISCCLCLSVKV